MTGLLPAEEVAEETADERAWTAPRSEARAFSAAFDAHQRRRFAKLFVRLWCDGYRACSRDDVVREAIKRAFAAHARLGLLPSRTSIVEIATAYAQQRIEERVDRILAPVRR